MSWFDWRLSSSNSANQFDAIKQKACRSSTVNRFNQSIYYGVNQCHANRLMLSDNILNNAYLLMQMAWPLFDIAFSSTSWSIENRCEKCSNNKYLQRAACKHWTHHFPFFSQYISMHSNVNMSILVAIKYTNRLVSLLTIQRTSIRIGWNFPQDFRRRHNGPPIS